MLNRLAKHYTLRGDGSQVRNACLLMTAQLTFQGGNRKHRVSQAHTDCTRKLPGAAFTRVLNPPGAGVG